MKKITQKTSQLHDQGVYATDLISRGELIITMRGKPFHRSETDFSTYHLQIGEDLYLGPSGNLDDYINHSCAPNIGFADCLDLIAIRDILPGEEITWDYSTAIDEENFEGFPCTCNTANCRKIVGSFRYLPVNIQQRLYPYLLPYLKTKYFSNYHP